MSTAVSAVSGENAVADGFRSVTRIAALVDTFEVSGPGRQLAALATELAKRDVQLSVALLHRSGRAYPPFAQFLADTGVTHAVVPDGGPLDFRIVDRVGRVLDQWRSELIQTHSYRMTFVAAGLRALGDRRPWIGFFHGATAEDRKVMLYHWLDRRVLGRADRIVVMSAQHARDFRRFGSRVRIVHNAVLPSPKATGATPSLRAGPRVTGRVPLIGVVGRLSHEKGVDCFLDACQILVQCKFPFLAVIAGDGPERESLLTRLHDLKLSEHVSFLGRVDDVRSLYERLDLLVIPSRSEGLPNVLLEALAADVPVVSTRVGAVPEVLADPLAGLVVEVADPRALANGIVEVIGWGSSPLAMAARAQAVKRFSLTERANSMVQVYDELSRGIGGRSR